MSRYEALLFLHVASAFAFIAAYTIATAILIAVRRVESTKAALVFLRLARPADVLAWVGATGTLVFGVWLAVDMEGYELWDAWILSAFAFWLVAEEAIRREDLVFRRARRLAVAPALPRAPDPASELGRMLRAGTVVGLHVAGCAALLAVLALMIFKPGAA